MFIKRISILLFFLLLQESFAEDLTKNDSDAIYILYEDADKYCAINFLRDSELARKEFFNVISNADIYLKERSLFLSYIDWENFQEIEIFTFTACGASNKSVEALGLIFNNSGFREYSRIKPISNVLDAEDIRPFGTIEKYMFANQMLDVDACAFQIKPKEHYDNFGEFTYAVSTTFRRFGVPIVQFVGDNDIYSLLFYRNCDEKFLIVENYMKFLHFVNLIDWQNYEVLTSVDKQIFQYQFRHLWTN